MITTVLMIDTAIIIITTMFVIDDCRVRGRRRPRGAGS
jgi:hypothetical protein